MVNKKAGLIIAIIIVVLAVACILLINSGNKDEAPDFVMSFDANGGSGEMADLKCDIGSSITIPECTFNNDVNFRVFVSWNTEQDGSGNEFAPGDILTPEIAKEETLYAQWELYTMSDLGIGTTISYEMSGGYSYSVYSYKLSGSMKDVLTGISETERIFERTTTTTVTYYDPSIGKDRSQTNTDSGKQTESRDIVYEGTPCKITTKWGVKDAIRIESDRIDDAGNTLHTTEYRDAESFIRYEVTLTIDNYNVDGIILKGYHMTYTLSSYDVHLD